MLVDTEAMRPPSPTAGNCEETAAMAAVEEYQHRLRGRLVTEALEESASTVVDVVEKLVQGHKTSVQRVCEENEALRSRLALATSVIRRLGGRVAAFTSGDAVNTVVDAVSEVEREPEAHTVPPRAVEVKDVSGTSSSAGLHTVHSESVVASDELRSVVGTDLSNDGTTCGYVASSRCTTTALPVEDPKSLAALLADHTKASGEVRLLEDQVAQYEDTLRGLGDLLTRVVKENAAYRQEVALLRATTVPLEEHQAALEAKEHAIFQREEVKREVAALTEQLDRALQQKDAHEALCEPLHRLSALGWEGNNRPVGVSDDARVEHPHTGMWNIALRELEEQATLVANHQTVHDRWQAAEAQLAAVEAEKAALQQSLDILTAEDACVRADAEGLVYRNGVLSQQVASLLVKVEHLKRSLREGHVAKVQLSSRTVSDMVRGSTCGSSREILSIERSNGSTPVSEGGSSAMPSAVARQQHFRASSSDGALAASAAQQLLRRRSNTSAPSKYKHDVTLPPSLSQQHHTLNPRQQGMAASLRNDSTDHNPTHSLAHNDSDEMPMSDQRATGRGHRALANSSELDLSFIAPQYADDEQKRPPFLGIERGLRASLSTFSTRRRTVTLRNMGCAAVEVDPPAPVPGLPSSDRLSGVALGRPCSYALMDPITGAMNHPPYRRPSDDHARTECPRPTRLTRSASDAVDLGSGEGDSAPCISDDDGSERKDLLEMLDMLDSTEQLDRFSVNSVAELVVRNQELVQQLYDTTQRAEASERQVEMYKAREDSPLVQSSVVAEESITSDTEAAAPPLRLCLDKPRKRARESIDGVGSASDLPSLTRPSTEGAVAHSSSGMGNACHAMSTPQDSALSLQDIERGLPTSVKTTVEELVATVLDRHQASVALADHGLSAALLTVVDACQMAGRRTDGERASGSASETLRGSVVTSLVQLCLEQAVELAKQTQELVEAQASERMVVRQQCWDTAQHVLQRTVHGLQEAFLDKVAARVLPAVNPAHSEAVQGEVTTTPTRSDEVALWERMMQLLRTAAQKEHSIRHVHLAAQARQRLALEKQQRRLRRFALASAEATSSSPAPPSQLPGSTNATPHLHPADGSAHQEMETVALPRAHRTARVFSFAESDADSDEEHGGLYTSLRQQLALKSAEYRKLTEDFSAERGRHIALCERMWQLEAERDAAVRAADVIDARMKTMMSREEYESIVADLDAAKAAVEDVNAQLTFAQRENSKLVTDVDLLKEQVGSHQQRCDNIAMEWAGRVRQRESEIAKQQQRNADLVREQENLQNEVSRLHQAALHDREVMAEQHQRLTALDAQGKQLKSALLACDVTQQLLHDLYPGDTVLAAHAEMVASLQASKAKLEVELSSAYLQLTTTQNQLDEKEAVIRQVVQERQAAEVRLQDALASALSRDGLVGSESGGGIAHTASPLARHQPLQHRVLELEAQVEAYREEVALLQEEKSAWEGREDQLREQLDAMSRDPVSAVVRQHGLKACRSFEAAVAEMNNKIEALEDKLAQSREEARTAEGELARAQAARTAAEENVKQQLTVVDELQQRSEALREELLQREALLAEQRQQHEADDTALREHGEKLKAAGETIAQLQAAVEASAAHLKQCEAERAQFFDDNCKLVEKVSELQRELARSDAEKRAANAALAQGISSASRPQHPRSAFSRTGRPLLGRPSVTGDLGT